MKRAIVEVWDAERCLARAQAKEAQRLPQTNPTHIVFLARLEFTMPGTPVMVRYLRDGEPHSQASAQAGGDPNPGVAVLPKAEFEAGDAIDYAFAGAIADWDPPAELMVKAGAGSVVFDLEIYDPKTGERQVHHCTGNVQ